MEKPISILHVWEERGFACLRQLWDHVIFTLKSQNLQLARDLFLSCGSEISCSPLQSNSLY